MDAVLGFFSDLILFTGGLAVGLFWLLIMAVVFDEVIDFVITLRNRKIENKEITNE